MAEHDLREKLSFEERLEDHVRVMRPFRKPARSPKVLAGLIRLGGRGAASFYLLIFPARPSEGRYLNAIGVSDEAEGTASFAMMMQGLAYWFGTATLITTGTFGPKLLWGTRPVGAVPIISQVLFLIVMPGALTLFCAVSGFTAQNRLFASAFRAARLLRALSPDPIPSPERMTVETLLLRRRRGTHRRDQAFQLLLRNPRYRRRVVAGVAWALTRDTSSPDRTADRGRNDRRGAAAVVHRKSAGPPASSDRGGPSGRADERRRT